MMSFESNKNPGSALPLERRIIRVDDLPDQAGITAALRRAFAAGRPAESDDNDVFADLLDRIH